MNTCEMIFAGVGGQGLVLCGTLLGSAACIHSGKKAVMTTAYGVETRGTFTKSDLIISDGEIDFPEVEQADIVLALTQESYDRYVDGLATGATLFYDSGAVEKTRSAACTQVGHPIAARAAELGSRQSVNIYALGLIVGHTGVLEQEAVRRSIRDHFGKNEKVADANCAIFTHGVKAGEESQ